ncbi:NADP-reducing hydrogenase subunit HndC [Stieleria maiorica]|uniref:NADP-reducing hydrogenase subunit HndC n=1 Tax=Stieleria maiorica TaxID=2795974 RepID=A0A5B9MDY3_9BACT|nr:NADH-quinone oxidoreductase subunit NuoF [Stieleria maiorica]QEF97467.1 NADP-reducing hydrogenase subunit HndC [Stieleria maiorica]
MNLEDLADITEAVAAAAESRRHCVRVCMAASCQSCGSGEVLEGLQTQAKQNADDGVCIKPVGCMGLCSAGPLVSVDSDQPATALLYQDVTVDDTEDLYHSLGDQPVERLRCRTDVPFFARQQKVVLENSGIIDPEQIDDYIAAGGYRSLMRAVTEMSREEVLREVKESGLRGRGGGGYPAGLKWATVAMAPEPHKYVICNADEGDPGAFMDRAVLESDPHRVLEGMALAGYAVGAEHAYIYIRAEYPLAVERLKTAIKQATKKGLLGRRICETALSFEVEVRLGAGAFVCGEETALMASIEGRRGQPRPRPPYPAEEGLWKCPTLINNVETLANIPAIVGKGGAWFKSIGTENSTGTKVFALAGRIANSGLIEVPMGIPLREIVHEIGGGIPDGRRFKAVQTGGPSGGCLPEQFLDMPVEYDTLRSAGSIMGSGGMIVMDETSSMVDVARYFMEFCMDESCGKCVPCRAGTVQLYGLLDKIADGEATPSDLELLEELCDVVQATSLCGLGQTAPNPVLSTLRYFRHEYEEKLRPESERMPRMQIVTLDD